MKNIFLLSIFCLLISACDKDELVIKQFYYTPSSEEWNKTGNYTFSCPLQLSSLTEHNFNHGTMQTFFNCGSNCWKDLPAATSYDAFNCTYNVGGVTLNYTRLDGANWLQMPGGLQFKVVLTFEKYDK